MDLVWSHVVLNRVKIKKKKKIKCLKKVHCEVSTILNLILVCTQKYKEVKFDTQITGIKLKLKGIGAGKCAFCEI